MSSHVPLDTDRAAHELQLERLRAMTMAERAELLDQMCDDVDQMARAAIRRDHPDLSEQEALHELARRR